MNTLFIAGITSMLFVAAFTWHQYRNNTGPGQTPRGAIIEAWTNIVIGFTINWLANMVLIPLMSPGGHMTLAANFWGGWIYTAVSVLRQFTIRRWFNSRIHRLANTLARL
jgi:hypothetical protein